MPPRKDRVKRFSAATLALANIFLVLFNYAEITEPEKKISKREVKLILFQKLTDGLFILAI